MPLSDDELARINSENAEWMRRHHHATDDELRRCNRAYMARLRRRRDWDRAAVGICILAALLMGLVAFGVIR